MNTVTHALLPTLLALPALPRETRTRFLDGALVVTLGGALPDLLHPHLSLAARYTSWPHSVFALGAFGLLCAAVAFALRRRYAPRVAVFAWVAYALHLVGDAISGGIAPLYPVSNVTLSWRCVPYGLWWWCDGACLVLVCIALATLTPRRRQVASAGKDYPAGTPPRAQEMSS